MARPKRAEKPRAFDTSAARRLFESRRPKATMTEIAEFIADRVGSCSVQYVSKLLNPARSFSPSVDVVRPLADFFGVDPAVLLPGDPRTEHQLAQRELLAALVDLNQASKDRSGQPAVVNFRPGLRVDDGEPTIEDLRQLTDDLHQAREALLAQGQQRGPAGLMPAFQPPSPAE